ncbi:hypothetical protein J19TS2_47450 [Cohnella xylanilytica]|uniref:Ig-like domain-containing protein n=1 Tax=Cohnella xylanilytica TaxID=557555 RepID=UPI001B260E3F|nr:Ig-like domain-containing protein [Cohnella xylanilytica]GIO15190.1 hypothetical protein J19TS2_47450 [Cohnella xylanilytica]
MIGVKKSTTFLWKRKLSTLMSAVLVAGSVAGAIPASVVHAAEVSDGIKASDGRTPIENGTNVAVDPGLTINYNGNLNGANVVIANYQAGDTLAYTTSLPSGVSVTRNANGVLIFSGTASVGEYQALLQSVTFSTTSKVAVNREIKFSLGSALPFNVDGVEHYYEFIQNKNANGQDAAITWYQARDKAASEDNKYFGRQGYLATITSKEENDFVSEKAQGLGWLGAADISKIENPTSNIDGDWRWVTGPEGKEDNGKGLHFWQGYSNSGVSVDRQYHNWDRANNPPEPNNYNGSGEFVAHIYPPTDNRRGKWNDYSPTNTSVTGYIVEYGGMEKPEDLTIDISATKEIEDPLANSLAIASPAEGAIVGNGKPAIQGTTEVGSTVTVTIKDKAGNVVKKVDKIVESNGNWSYMPDTELSDGDYTIEVTASKDGKTTAPVKSKFTVDTNLELSVTNPSGNKATTSPNPEFTGTTEAGVTVTVKIKDSTGKEVEGTATADANGNWSYKPAEKLAPGSYTLEVTATRGEVAAEPITVELTVVDKEALQTEVTEINNENLKEEDYTTESWKKLQEALTVAEEVLNNPNANQEAVNKALEDLKIAKELKAVLEIKEPSGNTVYKPNPVITGTTEVDAKVKVKVLDQNDNEVDVGDTGDATVDENGNWTYTPTNALPDGHYKLVVTAERLDGKTTTLKKDITVDTAKPELAITEPSGDIVTTSKPTIEGTAVPNSKVTVKIGDQTKTIDVGEDGKWSYTPETDLTDGLHTVEVTVEKDGKTNKTTKDITVDTKLPEVSITAPSGDIVTTSKPTIEGTAVPNSKVTVKIGDQTKTIDVGVDGKWSYTPETDLTDGLHTVEVTVEKDGKTNTITKKITVTKPSETVVDKSKLQTEVDRSAGLNESEYTADSWTKYQAELAKAKEVLANEAATQEQVDAAQKALQAAREALTPKSGNVGGLQSLVPSKGTLEPNFSAGVYSYSMTVSNSVKELQFTMTAANPGAAITVNGKAVPSGQASGPISLNVGDNIVTIVVKEQDGSEKTYTVTVTRKKSTGGGGSAPAPTVEKITVDVEATGHGVVAQTEIERTSNNDGTKSDLVTFETDRALEAVEKTLAAKSPAVRVVIPDEKDEVKDVRVDLPDAALKAVKDAGLDLEIYTDNGMVTIPNSSLSDLNPNLYFYLVPIKKEEERKQVEERARTEQIVREMMQNNNVYVVDRPMTIETNMTSRKVKITLPMNAGHVPTEAKAREAYLSKLVVFIEHSDGDRELVKPEIGTYSDGKLGLSFTIDKFSTFTILNVENPDNAASHKAYIVGLPDGTFGPAVSMTRAQVAMILYRVLELKETGTAPSFPDVSSKHWAAEAIRQVTAAGLMIGMPDGSFKPEQVITRAEMATIIARWKGLEGAADNSFNDVAGHWGAEAIGRASQAGYMEGMPDGSFQPNKVLTRAEGVTVFNRVLGRGPLYGMTEPTWSDVPMSHWAFYQIEEASKDHDYTSRAEGGETIVK